LQETDNEELGRVTDDFSNEELNAVLSAIERDLGDHSLWFAPDGYPSSLALCVIDSIFSIGVKYQGVVNVVKRYRQYRLDQSGNADADGGLELMGTFQHLDGFDGWASKFENRQRTSTRSGILKAEAVMREAHTLADHGVWSVRDLHTARTQGRLDAIKSDWTRVPGQRSGISWSYFLMLARVLPDGEDGDVGSGPSAPYPDDDIAGVKPDRMIKRYIADAIGTTEQRLSDRKAAALVKAAANAKGYDVVALDHAIWRFQSQRPSQRGDEA
jgi:hypothetical protein